MGRNDERRHRNDPGPVPGLPLKVAPGVGEHRGADGVLRRYLDPGATLFRAPTARRAVNTFVRERAQDLGTDGADLREVGKEENEATLNVRYQQFHQDVPIFGATLQVVADTGQAAVVQVENTTELDVSDAPDASEAMAPDVVEKAALAPFEEGYETASVVRDDLVYLRDTTRPPLPEADRPTASVALLKKGKRRPDGKLHLVHDLVVETSGPFEHFRVVVDAVGGKLLWVEVAGRYATATLKVFIPDPVTSSNSATLSSLSSDADLKPHAHEVQAEIKEADDAGKFHLDGDWCRCLDWDDSGFPQPEPTEPSFVFDTHPNDKAFLSANAYYWVDSFARYLRGLGNTTLNAKMVPVDVDPQGVPTADKSEWIGTTNPPRMRFDMKLVPGAADLGIIVHEYTHGVVQWLRAGATTPLEYEHSICDVMAGVYRDLESLNESFRYQLTAIGAPAPDLHVSRPLTDHTFEIAGGAAGLDVCWQITGVRCDNWARANPLIADKSKSAEEKGLLVHPELIGRPADRCLSALVTPGVASSDAVPEDAADRTPP